MPDAFDQAKNFLRNGGEIGHLDKHLERIREGHGSINAKRTYEESKIEAGRIKLAVLYTQLVVKRTNNEDVMMKLSKQRGFQRLSMILMLAQLKCLLKRCWDMLNVIRTLIRLWEHYIASLLETILISKTNFQIF